VAFVERSDLAATLLSRGPDDQIIEANHFAGSVRDVAADRFRATNDMASKNGSPFFFTFVLLDVPS